MLKSLISLWMSFSGRVCYVTYDVAAVNSNMRTMEGAVRLFEINRSELVLSQSQEV